MRKCNCSGVCGPTTYTRREFLELTAAGAASALFARSALGQNFALPANELEEWKRSLRKSEPRLYHSGTHTDARMHLGGIGTGNFEIGVDGQFTRWQLFNTLRDGHVPLHFAVKAGPVARLLQTTGGPAWPRVERIEMTGEYPFARLRFIDPALPVQVELEAFTPFVPLDVPLSSLPAGALIFRLRNTSNEKHAVSLAAFMQNPIGYDARGQNDWTQNAHPAFGGNINAAFQVKGRTGVSFGAAAVEESKLERSLLVLAGRNLQGLNAPPVDRPDGLDIRVVEQVPKASELPEPSANPPIIWLEDAPAEMPESFLKDALELTRAGATLLLSGRTMPLLRAYAAASGGKPIQQATLRPDIVFEDFESGYGNWTVEGEAFGTHPAQGTLPNQQRVSGFLGAGLVNTYLKGDDTTGKITSKSFTIERHFIRFLAGGGHHSETQIRLIIGGKTVRSAGGRDNERLEPASWEVREFAGQTAQIVIVDEQKGGWGHINIDQITFSDQAANYPVLALLDEIMPARFSQVRELPVSPGKLVQVQFENQDPQAGTQQSATRAGLALLVRPLGKGKVVLAAGQVLDAAHAEWSVPRLQAYGVLCELAGIRYLPGNGQSPKAPGFGTVALGALLGEGTILPAFTNWAEAWKQFSENGRFSKLSSEAPAPPSLPGQTVNAALATSIVIEPGATADLPILLCWHYPNKYNSGGLPIGCQYTQNHDDARSILHQVADRLPELRAKTELFRRALYESSMPYWLLDCLTANAAIARHIGVVFRIANADVYGWEGSNGCCQPTCTHVWGYEQSLARLFPELERDMRRIDFKHQQRADGGVNNRTDVPSPPRPTGEQPFADGHASCVLKAYREALNSPDESFFREYWPHVRKAIDYLIARDAKSHGEPAGYLEDDQWNTYDEALHGVTTFISGYYLAALRAGEEWARRAGQPSDAARWRAIFEKGREKLVELCWNGEYFQQHLPDYAARPGEVGPGCMADQLIGQWWAHQLGLGYILPKEMVVTALQSVYRYNFKTDLTGWQHVPRPFAGAKDKGLIICTWPKGGRPNQVMLYSDEVWTGIEYQFAAHLVYEGLIDEGLAVAKAARDRYDGVPRAPIARNPWDEIECGGHYARAMSSWSLLLALSGWEYDGPRQMLRLSPKLEPASFKSFWSGPSGWGSLSRTSEPNRQVVLLSVHSGQFDLRQFSMPAPAGAARPGKVQLSLRNETLPAALRVQADQVEVVLDRPANARAGEAIELRFEV